MNTYVTTHADAECEHALTLFCTRAQAGIIVYPVGIGLSYFAFLWLYRRRINPDMTRFIADATAAHDHAAMDASSSTPNVASGSDDGRRSVLGSDMTVSQKALLAALQIRRLDPHIDYASFLFEAYKPEYFYFEVIETMRRILFTSVVLVIHSNRVQDQTGSTSGIVAVSISANPARLMFSLMLGLGVIAVYGEVRPFYDQTNNYVAQVATWQVALTLLGAMILQSSDYYDALGGKVVVAVILCFVNLSACAAVVPAVAQELHRARHRKRKFKRLCNAAQADPEGPAGTTLASLLTRQGGEAIWNIESVQRDVVSYSFLFVCILSASPRSTSIHQRRANRRHHPSSVQDNPKPVEMDTQSSATAAAEEENVDDSSDVNHAMRIAIRRYDAMLNLVHAEPDVAFFRWHGHREYAIITRMGVAKSRALLLERCFAHAGLRCIISGTRFTGEDMGRELKYTNAAIHLITEVHTRRLRLRLISDSTRGRASSTTRGVPSQAQVLEQWGGRLRRTSTYVKTTEVFAKMAMEDGVIDTIVDGVIESRNEYAAGAYIVVGSRGGRYAMQPDVFAARYDHTRPIDPNSGGSLAEEGFKLFQSMGIVYALELSEDHISMHFPMGQFIGSCESRTILTRPSPVLLTVPSMHTALNRGWQDNGQPGRFSRDATALDDGSLCDSKALVFKHLCLEPMGR